MRLILQPLTSIFTTALFSCDGKIVDRVTETGIGIKMKIIEN